MEVIKLGCGRISNFFTNLREGLQLKMQDKDEVVEFWLEGFNGDLGSVDMREAFADIVKIYDGILWKDPNWHYFYEASYSLIRCSLKFRDQVERYFKDNSILYEYRSKWKEDLYVTKEYQKIFKQMFHAFSVLTIELYKNGDGDQLYAAADRVCHCFHNHAIYLANAEGALDKHRGYDINMWEAEHMAKLGSDRAYYIGLIRGRREAMAYYKQCENKKKDNGG